MDIFNLLTSQLNDPNVLNKLSRQASVSPEKAKEITAYGLPALLQALNRNSSSASGAESLLAALDQHKDDDVDDVNIFLDKVNTAEGGKMLQHIFSGNNERVQSNIAKQTGLKQAQVSGVLTQLAPMLIGMLGKKKHANNLDQGGISSLLGSALTHGSEGGIMDIASNLLDSDNDGSIIDDVGGLLGKFFKK